MIHTTSPHALAQSLDLLIDTYNYNHWIYSFFRPYLGDHICEVGGGTGNLTRFFLAANRVVCVEPEPEFCASLRRLGAVHLNLTVVQCDLREYAMQRSTGLADSVVCGNVLEHIEEHGEALALMSTMVKPEGCVLLYVPAAPWAFGSVDEVLGHYRRYSKRGIDRLAGESGLRVVASRYVNMLGAFGWWWCSRVRRQTEIEPRNVRLIDRYVPYISAIERLFPPVVGQSLFAVLKKEEHA